MYCLIIMYIISYPLINKYTNLLCVMPKLNVCVRPDLINYIKVTGQAKLDLSHNNLIIN